MPPKKRKAGKAKLPKPPPPPKIFFSKNPVSLSDWQKGKDSPR
jgi:hypothetical protein